MSNQVKTRSKKRNKAKASCTSKSSQASPKAQKQEVAEEYANTSKSEAQISAKNDLDQEKHVQTIEIRDKRINIVFKTIYVFAIFFAAVFIELSRQLSVGLTAVFVAEACLAAFLLAVIVCMVLYIISEMKCLKVSPSHISEKEISVAEESYSRIFQIVACGGGWFLFLFFISIQLVQYFTQGILMWACFGCTIVATVVLLIFQSKPTQKWAYIVGMCAIITAVTCFLCVLPLSP